MMDPNKAVQYQNPAHVHDGTSAAAFTVATSLADTTRLAPTGIERVGTSADLPLDLAAKGKGPVNALGGPLVVGLCNTACGGFLPRPYTAVPGSDRLLLAGGDYSSEFTSDEVYYTDGELYRYTEVSVQYNPTLNQTELRLDDDVNSASGYVVDACAQGLAAGFGNILAGASAALGQLCISVGQFSLAAGTVSHAFGTNSVAIGNSANAYGTKSAALGQATAASDGSCDVGNGKVGTTVCSVFSLTGTTVRIYGDVRSRFAAYDGALLFNNEGDRHRTVIASEPTYSGGMTTLVIAAAPSFTPESIVNTTMGVYAFASGSSQATGDHSHAEGFSNATANYAHSEGYATTASGDSAHVEGGYTAAAGQYAHAEGYYTTAAAKAAHAGGYYSAANKQFQRALASGRFATAGDSQYTEVVLRRATADATPVELTLDGAAPSGTIESTSNRFLCATGKTYACLIMIAARKSDGVSAFFLRQVVVKNIGDAVALEGAPQTLGVDINPAGWTLPAITADSANKSLAITVTGAASTNIRWSATVQSQEITY